MSIPKQKRRSNGYKQRNNEGMQSLLEKLRAKFPKECEFYRDLFGPKAGIENLKRFFQNEVIQKLWWEHFRESDQLRRILEKLSLDHYGKF